MFALKVYQIGHEYYKFMTFYMYYIQTSGKKLPHFTQIENDHINPISILSFGLSIEN